MLWLASRQMMESEVMLNVLKSAVFPGCGTSRVCQFVGAGQWPEAFPPVWHVHTFVNGVAPCTVWGRLWLLPSQLACGAYRASTWVEPTGRSVVVVLALPASNATVASGVPLVRNRIWPVGVPAVEVTEALNWTLVPLVAGLWEDVIVVEEAAGCTVTFTLRLSEVWLAVSTGVYRAPCRAVPLPGQLVGLVHAKVPAGVTEPPTNLAAARVCP